MEPSNERPLPGHCIYMKKYLTYSPRYLLLFLLLLASGQLFAQEVLVKHFTIKNDGIDILVQWELKNEADITEFHLYRKFNDDPTLNFVAALPVNGSKVYEYLDVGVFKNNPRVLQYELHVFKGTEVTKIFSNPLVHTHTSILKQTWGSIKSMFR